jgi:CheY-like chemotaxis protein
VGDEATVRRPIVIVDDNDDDRFLFRRMLQRVVPDTEVIEYEAADLALPDFADDERFAARFGESRPLVMLDINMPRMSGFEFLDVLGPEKGARIDVIIVSASDSPCDRERAAAFGMVRRTVEKPMTRPVIVELFGSDHAR